MAVQKITAQNFDALVKNNQGTVLLDFYADWCGPCRMVSPVVDEIAEEREDVLVGKINVDDEASLAMAFGVVSIPMLVVVRAGKIITSAVGVQPKAGILAMLDQ